MRRLQRALQRLLSGRTRADRLQHRTKHGSLGARLFQPLAIEHHQERIRLAVGSDRDQHPLGPRKLEPRLNAGARRAARLEEPPPRVVVRVADVMVRVPLDGVPVRPGVPAASTARPSLASPLCADVPFMAYRPAAAVNSVHAAMPIIRAMRARGFMR